MSKSSSLEERCLTFYRRWSRKSVQSEKEAAAELADFVRSEVGRTADKRLDKSKALVLYFSDDQDRSEFVNAVREEIATRGSLVTRELP